MKTAMKPEKKPTQTEEQRGRYLTAPVKTLTIGDTEVRLVFNNRTIRRAEDVYAEQYGKDTGFSDILRQLAMGRYNAIMAILYAAMVEGGRDMPWAEYDQNFRVTGIAAARETIMQGIADSMPGKEAGDPPETPGRIAPIPGRG